MGPAADSPVCDLCGLPLGRRPDRTDPPAPGPRFCCAGCRMVWTVLSEAGVEAGAWRDTPLFRECQQRGIIPRDAGEAVGLPDPAPPMTALPPPDHLRLAFTLSGMWCPACAWVIERALLRTPGVRAAACDFLLDRLRCDYDPARTAPDEIARGVARLGYRAAAPSAETQERLRRRAFVRLALCAFLTANVMMFSLALYTGFFTRLEAEQVRLLSLPVLALSAAVLVYGGGPLLRRAAAGIAAGAPGMEALIGLAALSAYGYSLVAFLGGSLHLYADTACMLIVLALVGQLLEGRARDRARDLLGALPPMQPAKARVVTPAHPRGRFVAAEGLRPGDRLRVAAGEWVPADGPVLAGSALLDESCLTGEALPVRRGVGDTVASGARVASGEIELRADGVGDDSTAGRMAAMVARALAHKSPREAQAERLLRRFVPAVVLLAAATAAALLLQGGRPEEALLRGITVLVISCPCALGLAIPLARVAGIALAGRAGILVSDFSAFEAARGIGAVAFDKTGTLSGGRWELLALEASGALAEATLLAWAAGLEEGQVHPVAFALREAARARGIAPAPAENRRVHPQGISGRIAGHAVRLGSAPFAVRDGAQPPAACPWEDRILSQVWLGVAGQAAGRFIFGDRLKPGAAAAVADLEAMGCRVLLLSGDHPADVAAAARAVGIAESHAALSPAAKAEIVQQLGRETGVAMVGDGINDAPALAAADLGMAAAVRSGPWPAGAAVVLMGGDPAQVPRFLRLARRVRRCIVGNLLFSALYNLVCIPVAMAGLLSPLVAVCAMLLSSLSVTLSTLHLLRRPGGAS